MASHDVSWVLGAHMCFGNLDFIIMMEGELVKASATVQPLHSTGLDMTIDAFRSCSYTRQRPMPLGATSSSALFLGG